MVTMPIIYSRTVWQDPFLPVNSSTTISWSEIDTVAPHYTAAVNLPDGDVNEYKTHIPPYLRAIQRDYQINRGYSIGYNWAIDWLGGIWELRGWDFKCAANAGHNNHVISVLCLVDGADPLTDEAAASMRFVVGMTEQKAGRRLAVKGHRQLPAATGCPGNGIVGQINEGLFASDYGLRPAIKIGDQDTLVNCIQLILNEKSGSNLTVDGYFGPETAHAWNMVALYVDTALGTSFGSDSEVSGDDWSLLAVLNGGWDRLLYCGFPPHAV